MNRVPFTASKAIRWGVLIRRTFGNAGFFNLRAKQDLASSSKQHLTAGFVLIYVSAPNAE